MDETFKNRVILLLAGLFFFGFFMWCLVGPKKAISESERRPLKAMPKIQMASVMDGRFMEQFEAYSQDQFPMREKLRAVKAFFALKVLQQKDNHGIYMADGYLAKAEYPLNEESVQNAGKHFSHIYEKYLQDLDCDVYLSVIPDKNYFLADGNGYPKLDYDKLTALICGEANFAQYIDIFSELTIDSYYRTDTHWKQEQILNVALKLTDEMAKKHTVDESEGTEEWQLQYLEKPFYGVYAGQYALPVESERIAYYNGKEFDDCVVTDYEISAPNNKIAIYDMKKAQGLDPYEMFLSGSKSLLTIENPHARYKDRQLIIFRDSFGSSIAPLFINKYGKITLVDIRYISSEYLGKLIDFNHSDVIFLYSTLVLNNSVTMK